MNLIQLFRTILLLLLFNSTVLLAEIKLQAPSQVGVGASVVVSWQGLGEERDFITIVAKNAAEGKYKDYQYARKGGPVSLIAPDNPGEYEIRYLSANSPYNTLARAALTIIPVTASITAPAEVVAGSEFSFTWSGPDNPQDFVTLVPGNTPDKKYKHYQYTKKGSQLKLRAPDEAGQYELRYMMGSSLRTLAKLPLLVTATSASLNAPDQVIAGATVSVSWQGPDNPQDFITIVKQGADEKKYASYRYTKSGNPVEIQAPETAGDYEFRYLTGGSYATLAVRAVRVLPATASVQAPDRIELGDPVPVSWEGPGNRQDYIMIVAAGSLENRDGPYAYVHRGKDLRVASPREVGDYEVRYVTGELNQTLASRKLRVAPSSIPGSLRVLRSDKSLPDIKQMPAIAVILDASGSMLQRMEGKRRIDVAREALTELTQNILPENTAFALRVFGHREKDSCRTDLEIPLGPLHKASVKQKIASIRAMNLAKTPIAESLQRAVADLAPATGERIILLITDGEKTCGGDPAAVIKSISEAGYNLQVNIVGFAIDELMLRETFQEWARLGNGRYFDAPNAAQLAESMKQSTELSFEIINQENQLIGAGMVGGPPIKLPPGNYRLKLLDGSAAVFENIQIESEKLKTFNL